MRIELIIDGKKKIFTAPFVPMMAKRKWLEIQAQAEKREGNLTSDELMDEDDKIMSILTDIIFQKQFTLEELYNGASKDYIDSKLMEGIFGITEKQVEEGNEKGE